MHRNARTVATIFATLSFACAPTPSDAPVALRVTPVPLVFGHATIGARTRGTLEFRNPGSPARTLEFRTEGPAAADFEPPPPITIAPNTTPSVEVAFRPSVAGPRVARLVYVAGDETGAVHLHGIGTRVEISVADTLDFGAALEGETRTLEIANVASEVPETDADVLRFARQGAAGEWVVVAPALGGADASQFAIELPASPTHPDGIPPGGKLNLLVRFVPTSTGRKSATLTLTTNDAARPEVVVALEAELPAIDAACEWELAAQEVDLGAILGEGPVAGTIELTNRTPRSCRLGGIALAPGSAPAFALPGAGDVALAAGGTSAIPVTFSPTAPGRTYAVVELGRAPAIQKVSLFGIADAPLRVSRLEFPESACGGSQLIPVQNNLRRDLRIESARLVGSEAFELMSPEWPHTVKAYTSFDIGIAYRPPAAGDHEATLFLETENYTEAVPIHATSTGPGRRSDVFRGPPSRYKLDVLVVVDGGPTMAAKQQAVVSNLARFLRSLDDHFDYQFAITATSVDSAHGGSGSGAGYANGRLLPLDGSWPRVITQGTPDQERVLAQSVGEALRTSGDGFLFRPAMLALSEPLLSTHNSGFLRDDARLQMVFVSDGADRDPEPLATYVRAFLESDWSRRIWTVDAVVPTQAQPPERCSYHDDDAGSSRRMRAFAARVTGGLAEICSPTWGSSLITRWNFWEPRTRIVLTSRPDLSVVPEPIVVTLDGVKVDQVTADGRRQWQYEQGADGSWHALSIGFAWPLEDSTLSVAYEAICP